MNRSITIIDQGRQKLLEVATRNIGSQDRVLKSVGDDLLLLAIADGAGGMGNGAAAADIVIEIARSASLALASDLSLEFCRDLLRHADERIAADALAGQTTGIIAFVTGDRIIGASVGDSELWVVRHNTLSRATRNQNRKPLLGSGHARPISFSASLDGMAIMATDGLFKYASASSIQSVLLENSPYKSTTRLTDLVRYPSGTCPGDLAMIIFRETAVEEAA